MTDKKDQATALARQVAAALPMAQELRRAGWSFNRIADHLDADGIPTPSRWKGKPTRWNGKSVKRLLDQAGHVDKTAAPEQPSPSEQPSTPEQPSLPEQPPKPITVTGPITVTAPGVAITLTGFSGPVEVTGPFTVAAGTTATEEEPPAMESSIIQLSRYRAQEVFQALRHPGGYEGFPDPFFLRRRV